MNLDHSAFANAIELKSDDADANDIVTKALADLTATMEARLAAIETKAAEPVSRLDRLEAKLNRPAVHTKGEEAPIEQKAYEGYLRHGLQRMTDIETKALVLANDPQGGYLAPEALASEILKSLVEYSPIRSYATVTTIGAESIKLPRKTGTTQAVWVEEIEERSESQPSFGQMTIKPWELATFTDLSVQLLEDNAYNLMGELAEDFAENFGKTEGLAFVKGTGVSQPTGLMAAEGIAEFTTGTASGFPATDPSDVLIGMYHALPTAHAQRACWLMNRLTLGEIRKWKDGNGRYLIVDPISQGAPMTLLGRPIVEAVDMDDVGAGNAPILFGDLTGYRIVDRVGFSTMRDPYTLATRGQVRVHARKRVGADVTHPDRFIKLRVAA